MKYLILSLLFITPLTCTKPDTVTFTIKQGEHYSQGGRTIRQADLRAFRFYVDESWLHTEVNAGWNKLIGISDGQHHKNSVRIAWRCLNDQTVTFAAYTYYKGKWTAEELFSTVPGVWVTAGITLHDRNYAVRVYNYTAYPKRNKGWPNYTLYPYFGGKDTAPHDMKFRFDFTN